MPTDVRYEVARAASTVGLQQVWELDLDYVTLAGYASLVEERGLPHHSYWNWPTERMTLDGVYGLAVTTYRDRTERCAVIDLGDEVGGPCVAHLALEHEHAYVRASAQAPELLAEAEAWLRERYPETEPGAIEQRVTVAFWAMSAHTHRSSRTIDVPTWPQIEANYPAGVRRQLSRLCSREFEPDAGGQLLLWHGPPGTGKTTALRALAWEWREWCTLHYVVDPETFFGSAPRYMLDVLLDEEDDDRWRLLVLEDTGELLSADAKMQTGQGLSRLLNVVDGMIGQGLRVLVLVTTNEALGSLNAAVARPGRCAAVVRFDEFTPDEAAAWLAANGLDGNPRRATLAELYAGESERPKRPPIGFA